MIFISRPIFSDEEKKSVLKVLSSGNLSQGILVERFENKFSNMVGTKFAVATSNGTSALFLSLLALNIGNGDEVITSPFTFIATANSILHTGAVPVFVDIDPETFNINPGAIEEKITNKTKAIMPVHLYGLPAHMPEIIKIAKKHNLFIIEDACQSPGASIDNKMVGSFGNMGCFSFYPTKNITTGEGGMITTNNPYLSKKLKLLRNHGMKERYKYILPGYNFRMTDLQASIGLVQIDKLGALNNKRIKNADFYKKNLKSVSFQKIPDGYKHVFHQFTIRVPKQREKLQKKITAQGIQTVVYYPTPLHKINFFKGKKYILSESEKASNQVLSIPVHPLLSITDLEKVADTINKIL